MDAQIEKLRGKLIVSCQALPDEPLHSSFIMGRMALAAREGGAYGIRANSREDIEEIQRQVDLPVIGIVKRDYEDSPVRITATMREVDELMEVRPKIIAMDATDRLRPGGAALEVFYREVRKKYPGQLLMADCSTVEEAVYADSLGFDFIGTTLVGYTGESEGDKIEAEDFAILREILKKVRGRVIAEGNINTPQKAKRVIELGAFCVVVGSIITRPQLITKSFAEALAFCAARPEPKEDSGRISGGTGRYIALDVGGTAIKYGIIDGTGKILRKGKTDTLSSNGGPYILRRVLEIVEELLREELKQAEGQKVKGDCISATGMVDVEKGEIFGASPVIPDYVGTGFKKAVEGRFNLPCEVENDVNCAGLAEYVSGAAKGKKIAVMLTVGTGIGGCMVADGKVFHGMSGGAFEVGYMHLPGGAFETLGAASVLSKKVEERKGEAAGAWDGIRIFEAAKQGDEICCQAIDEMVDVLGQGIANICCVVNPQVVVLGGGIMAQKNFLGGRLDAALKKYLVPELASGLTLAFAEHENDAGMLGAFYHFCGRRGITI